MVLPAFGVVSELVTAAARKRIFGYWFIAFASIAIAVDRLPGLGPPHVRGRAVACMRAPSFRSFAIVVAVPSGDQGLQLDRDALQRLDPLRRAVLYALGFIGLFAVGGLTGLLLAMLAVDVHVTDTYFVVAHFHYIMVGGTVTAFFGALHFWWPKITGRMYLEVWAQIAAVLDLRRLQPDLLPAVHPRLSRACRGAITSIRPSSRCCTCCRRRAPRSWRSAISLPSVYLFCSLRHGRPAGPNPWGATGLEWSVPSPPPKHNFADIPVVVREPYDYPIKDPVSRG